MRGIASIAKLVAPLAAIALIPGPLVSGPRKPISTESLPSRAVSASVGAATLATTSAPHGSPIVAPASVNWASGVPAASPAPASTTTSWSLPRRRTTSGESATRRSPSAVSLGTPTLTGAGTYTRRQVGCGVQLLTGRVRGQPGDEARAVGAVRRERRRGGRRGRGGGRRGLAARGLRAPCARGASAGAARGGPAPARRWRWRPGRPGRPGRAARGPPASAAAACGPAPSRPARSPRPASGGWCASSGPRPRAT